VRLKNDKSLKKRLLRENAPESGAETTIDFLAALPQLGDAEHFRASESWGGFVQAHANDALEYGDQCACP
jgi:hypothetical protein